MLSESIKKLVQYGIETGLTPACEKNYTTNLLLDVFKEDEYTEPEKEYANIDLEEVLKELSGLCPILGVCLGHQAIGEVFGGRVVPAPELVHGKQSLIKTDTACKLFKGLPQEIEAARYHSLIVEKESLPECLKITAQTADGEIMALKHRDYEIYGVQFHPESVMTPEGMKILANFLSD